MHECFQEDFNYNDSIANYGYRYKKYIYKGVIQEGALQNLVLSVKIRLCRGFDKTLFPSGQEVPGRFWSRTANPAWALLCQGPGSREWFQLGIYPPALLPGRFCCSGSSCKQPLALQELLPSWNLIPRAVPVQTHGQCRDQHP